MRKTDKKFSQILKKIVRNKTHCYFVSPHLDDAVLSCGDLIIHLKDKVPVTVINVFTKEGDKPYTLSAWAQLIKCGYLNASDFYQQRRTEDGEVFKKLGVEAINLDFVEALYRKKKGREPLIKIDNFIAEFSHTYPIYRLHVTSGKVSKEDARLKRKLGEKLKKIISKGSANIIFCPLGVGGHVDHVLVRAVCSKSFSKLVYWSDFPYKTKNGKSEKFKTTNGLRTFVFAKNLKDKKEIIAYYKSQVKPTFAGGEIKISFEKYFCDVSKLKIDSKY